MSVIVNLRIPADAFELGRVLELEDRGTVVLETMVPLAERAVPFFSVHRDHRNGFEEAVRRHPTVESLTEVNSHGDRTLYALDWDAAHDLLFEGLLTHEGTVLNATGTSGSWHFELRFPTHDMLSDFEQYCDDAKIPLEVEHIYNPTRPDSGTWYGLTDPQRRTIARAVRGGYYSIPRRISTKELAEEFDVSDQAVTERLRRAIVTLVENTVIAAEESDVSAVEKSGMSEEAED